MKNDQMPDRLSLLKSMKLFFLCLLIAALVCFRCGPVSAFVVFVILSWLAKRWTFSVTPVLHLRGKI